MDLNQTTQTETCTKIPKTLSYSNRESEHETCFETRNNRTIIYTVIGVLLTFLPIATLIVGQIHKNDCPIETRIPQWMTIFGAVNLAVLGVLIFMVRI